MEAEATPRLYARFSRRFRALVVDSVVYAGSLVLLIALLEVGGHDRTAAGGLIFTWLGFLFLYEPVLVWRRGATLGHAWANIHVVDLRSGGNPTFLRAFGRFWLKGVFGLLAFAFMGTTRRHQALHDLAFDTTVEIRDPSRASAFDYLLERSPDLLRVAVPAWRRILAILAYSLLVFMLFGMALVVAESADCFNGHLCSAADQLWEYVLSLVWVGLQAVVVIFGWRGRLFGARGRPHGLAPQT